MRLSEAITKAVSSAEFNDIFAKKVEVQIDGARDKVTIEGFEGAVTTDFIARCVFDQVGYKEPNSENSKRLAKDLDDKVFMPLKTLVDSPEQRCSLYWLTSLIRIVWPSSPEPKFGYAIALRHAMILGRLDEQYCTWQ